MSLPSPAPTCCLPGFDYDSVTLKCINSVDHTIIADPLPCSCCPIGYVYIDGAGQFLYYNSTYITISNSPPNRFFNTCAKIVNGSFAIAGGSTQPMPFACPCCPVGFIWHSDIQACVDLTNPKHQVDPIPCIVCLCTAPPTPPPCVGCTGTRTAAINFSFDPTIAQCVDCHKVGEPTGLGGCIDSFIPIQLTDPLINFRLNS